MPAAVLRCLLFILTIVTSLIVGLSISPAARAEEEFFARVIGVSDGDTITVLHDGYPEKIRLADIDCPEKSQPFGKSAKVFTSQQVFGKDVLIKSQSHDRYGRTIATVVLPDGETLNNQLVAEGYAWQYRQYSHDPHLSVLESEARLNHRGLWQDTSAIPPWQYRHARRQR